MRGEGGREILKIKIWQAAGKMLLMRDTFDFDDAPDNIQAHPGCCCERPYKDEVSCGRKRRLSN